MPATVSAVSREGMDIMDCLRVLHGHTPRAWSHVMDIEPQSKDAHETDQPLQCCVCTNFDLAAAKWHRF